MELTAVELALAATVAALLALWLVGRFLAVRPLPFKPTDGTFHVQNLDGS